MSNLLVHLYPQKRRKIPEIRQQRAKERRQARRRPLIFVRVCPGFSRHEDRLVNTRPNLHSCWANRGPDTFHWHPHLSQTSREAHEKEEKVMASILGLSIGHRIGRSAAVSSSEEVWIEWLKIEGNYDRYRQPPSGLRKIDIAGQAAQYLSRLMWKIVCVKIPMTWSI